MSDKQCEAICNVILRIVGIVAILILVRGCQSDCKADPLPPQIQTMEVGK